MPAEIVYFSNYSGNTKRFVEKLDIPAIRIPVKWDADRPLVVDSEYILIVPTYGGGADSHAVPKSVIKFLNIGENRKLAVAIVGTGNTNFGAHYCLAADTISAKLNIPVIARVELLGTNEDIELVTERIQQLWSRSTAITN
jgi:protein involved in ribonucleotide reduction